MAKITLNDVANISGNPGSAEVTLNSNFAAIEAAIENTLSRDEQEPDQMTSDLDINSFRILNLPSPTSATEPLRLGDLAGLVDIGDGVLPNQAGHADEFLSTDGSVLSWRAPDLSGAIVTELLKHIVPKGTITMWSGSIGTIPSQWALCNGQNVVGFGTVPDLRNKFIVGAGSSYAVAATGGATSVTTSASGAHTPVVNSHILTTAEIPSHTHKLWAIADTFNSDNQDGFGTTGDVAIIGDKDSPGNDYITANADGVQLVESTGSSTGHTHSTAAVLDHTHTVATLPPYYALAYIIKTTAYVAP